MSDAAQFQTGVVYLVDTIYKTGRFFCLKNSESSPAKTSEKKPYAIVVQT